MIFKNLPEWMQAVIIGEAITFNVIILAGLIAVAWIRYELRRYRMDGLEELEETEENPE